MSRNKVVGLLWSTMFLGTRHYLQQHFLFYALFQFHFVTVQSAAQISVVYCTICIHSINFTCEAALYSTSNGCAPRTQETHIFKYIVEYIYTHTHTKDRAAK
jgi:hypothetical protein